MAAQLVHSQRCSVATAAYASQRNLVSTSVLRAVRPFGGASAGGLVSIQKSLTSPGSLSVAPVPRRSADGSETGFSGRQASIVTRSFFGVGAPEALLVGVVALVVFGPKGLADAARSLGQTLRAFQPTIREVVEVSQDLKGTLEKELGLDEIRSAARPTPRPQQSTSLSATQESLAEEEEDIEAKRRASAAMAWGGAVPAASTASTSSSDGTTPAAAPAAASTNGSQEQATHTAPASAAPAPAAAKPAPAPAAPAGDLAGLSMEQLEAELARRRAAAAGSTSGAGKA